MSEPLKRSMLVALAIFWLLAVIAGFWWFQARLVVTFDADQRVLNQYPVLQDYGQALSDAMPVEQGFSSTRITIIREPGCRCNRYSADHLNTLQHDYQATADFHWRRLDQLPAALQSLIPATPFVLIQRADGTLSYAGPVNSGISCTTDSSYLGSVLSHTNEAGMQIPLLARGCYCSTTLSTL